MKRLILCIPLLCGCAPAGSAPDLAAIARGQVTIVDLTYPLNEANPYWPGEQYKPFAFELLASLPEDGVYSGAFCTPEHLGTHIDAPVHFVAGQPSVDELPLTRLVAPLVVVDVREVVQENPDYQLSVQDLERWEDRYGSIPQGAMVLAYTGWGQRWNDFARYKNEDDSGQLHFPGFSPEAARFLVRQRGVVGLGIDTLSVDYGLSEEFQVHHIVHGAGGYHVENVANLDQVPQSGAWLLAAPIKIEGGSGGPARVWAVY